jgi:hypothetical protein
MFGVEEIQWFNGGLFDSGEVLTLSAPEIATLVEVSRLDWGRIEPAIFGTLFERGLDPAQRTQLGAHYTSRDDIWKLVEPVVIRPLRREYAAMQAQVTERTLRRDASPKKGPDPEARRLFGAFLERLRAVRILDPACGSGNFLYIALHLLQPALARLEARCSAGVRDQSAKAAVAADTAASTSAAPAMAWAPTTSSGWAGLCEASVSPVVTASPPMRSG